jgi:hypothetical protein
MHELDRIPAQIEGLAGLVAQVVICIAVYNVLPLTRLTPTLLDLWL